MSRIHDQHCVKLKPDRTRLNISNAGQKERRQDFAITGALFNLHPHFFQNALAGSLLNQMHQRFDLWMQPDQL
jgi:hypothetical protein